MREFLRIPGWSHKKRVFITKSAKKQILLTNSVAIIKYLGSLRHRTALQWKWACYFLWGTILAWGGIILVWGAQAVIWGSTAPEFHPWRRACCKFTAICWTVTIAFLFQRYCIKSVSLKKWELFEVIKRCPKPFSTIFFICGTTV